MKSDPETADIIFQTIILVISILTNVPFASSEMAVVSANKNKIRHLVEQGSRNTTPVERLMEGSTVSLPTTRVAITLTGFFSSVSTATNIAQVLAAKMEVQNMSYSQTLAGIVVTLILAYSSLVFGELMPKRIALQKAQGFSFFYVRPIYYISRIVDPFTRLLLLPTSGFLKLIGMHSESLEIDVSEEEVKSMLETGSKTGVFSDVEKEVITSISSFDDKRAKGVMMPRQDMVAADINDPMEEYIDEVLQPMRSEIPVYEGDIDSTIGVPSIKALTIEARRKSFDGLDIRSLLIPPYFTSENRRTDAPFREIQKNKTRLAILIDGYGGVADTVILEDLIEEVMGEIHEEHEEVEPEILGLKPHGTYRISGNTSLFDLKEGMHLSMGSSCDILLDYLMEQLGHISSQTELPITAVTEEVDYEIEGMDECVINYVKMTLKEVEKEEETREKQEQKAQEDMKMSFLLDGIMAAIWQQLITYEAGICLVWLAVKKRYRPPLLLPFGFGAILVNLPYSGVIDQMVQRKVPVAGIIEWLFKIGIEASEVMLALLFIGIGIMVDFGPLLGQPVLFLFGAAAQFGVSAAILIACMIGLDLKDAASTGIIGAVGGPTSILVSQVLGSSCMGPIVVATYSYVALVPIIQPFAIRLMTTHRERYIHMEYNPKSVSKTLRIAFPITVTIIIGLTSPQPIALVGFLMPGNLLRECSMLNSLSQAAQNELANLVTLLLKITISFSMQAEEFVNAATLMIMILGLVALVFDTIGDVLLTKPVSVFLKTADEKLVNPTIDGCGVSAFSMSSRAVQRMAAQGEPGSTILMQVTGTDVSGQVESVTADRLAISIVTWYLQDYRISGDCDKEE